MSNSIDTHPSDVKISPWLSWILYRLGSSVVLPNYFDRLDVTGQENVPRSGPVILAPTHRSRWDALIVPYAAGRLTTGRHLHYMVSANEMTGLQGWLIRYMGGYPVDPKHPGLSSLRLSVELLSQGKMVVIFPEGDIFRGQPVQPLKPGIARMALQAQIRRQEHQQSSVKIVPISIHYSQPYPRWRCDVSVKIGSPLNVANYSDGSARKNAPRLTQDLEAALRELHNGKSCEDRQATATA